MSSALGVLSPPSPATGAATVAVNVVNSVAVFSFIRKGFSRSKVVLTSGNPRIFLYSSARSRLLLTGDGSAPS